MIEQDLKKEVKDLTERLEWLLRELRDKEMLSEIAWFIRSNYDNKFSKEKK